MTTPYSAKDYYQRIDGIPYFLRAREMSRPPNHTKL